MQAETPRVGSQTVAHAPLVVDRSKIVRRWAMAICSCILLAVVVNLTIHGYSYYRLPVTNYTALRCMSELKPGGDTGRMLGISGSLMMITLLGYSLRKRVRFMREWGKLKTWLQVHIFLGVAGPILITFHTAFKLRGIVAISYWSMVIVAISGAVGRYLYAQIPRAISGAELEVKEINSQLEAINGRLREWLSEQQVERLRENYFLSKSCSAIQFQSSALHDPGRSAGTLVKRRLLQFARSAPALTHSQRVALPELARQRTLCARRITFLTRSISVRTTTFANWISRNSITPTPAGPSRVCMPR